MEDPEEMLELAIRFEQHRTANFAFFHVLDLLADQLIQEAHGVVAAKPDHVQVRRGEPGLQIDARSSRNVPSSRLVNQAEIIPRLPVTITTPNAASNTPEATLMGLR